MMEYSLQDFKQQLDKFNNIEFVQTDHTYIINGKVAPSVTSILKKYVKPFERDYWANIKAKQLGVEVVDILDKWEFNAKLSRTKGTLVHEFIESEFTKSQFNYPEDLIVKEFGYDPVCGPFNQIISVVGQFLFDIKDKMLPIASELVVGDATNLIGGTVDQIFYNKKSSNLEIWDWKTNKEIKVQSRYFHLYPLDHIPDTELDHYSLQLSLYKLIIERNTNLQLGNSYIALFNEQLPKYNIYKAHDYTKEAELILSLI